MPPALLPPPFASFLLPALAAVYLPSPPSIQGDIHSDLCVLHNEWLAINTTVPSLQQDAVCNGQFSPTANFSGVVAPGEACVR